MIVFFENNYMKKINLDKNKFSQMQWANNNRQTINLFHFVQLSWMVHLKMNDDGNNEDKINDNDDKWKSHN